MKEKIYRSEIQEFIINYLGIEPIRYSKMMNFNMLPDMTAEKHEELLNAIEKHFNKKLEIPSRLFLLRKPILIENCLNQTGKKYYNMYT